MKRVFVRILGLNTGSLKVSNHATVEAFVGMPKKSYPNHHTFKNDGMKCREFIWTLKDDDFYFDSFKITLYKRRILNGNVEIGHVKLNTRAFPPEKVIGIEVGLRVAQERKVKPRLQLEIHMTEDPNAVPFSAPRGKLLGHCIENEYHPEHVSIMSTMYHKV